MSTLLITHPACLDHLTPAGHPERPDRLRAIDRALGHERFRALVRVEAPAASLETIALCHPMNYVTAVRDASPKEGLLGLDADTTQRVVTGGHAYLKLLSGLPPTYHRLVAGDTLRIGGREFDVLTGGGHSPEQIMLVCRADNLFFSADQVLAKISPNVSVSAIDPEGDPLGQYLRSLHALRNGIGRGAMVLPGHNLPFYGLPERIEELVAHHHARCDRILRACRAEPRSAAELVPFVYTRKLDPHQMGFAFGEVLAHVNYMLRRGSLRPMEGAHQRVTAA